VAYPAYLGLLQMQDEIYLDNVRMYSLFVMVNTPESSLIRHKYCESPLAALASFQGLNSDAEAPEWTRLRSGRPLLFRQPRGAMAEVFSALAFWQDNHLTVWLGLFICYIKRFKTEWVFLPPEVSG
jgi:hypothetical protein